MEEQSAPPATKHSFIDDDRVFETHHGTESRQNKYGFRSSSPTCSLDPAPRFTASGPSFATVNNGFMKPTPRNSSESIESSGSSSKHDSTESSFSQTLREYGESGVLGLVDAEPSQRHMPILSPNSLSTHFTPSRTSRRSSRSRPRDSQIGTALPLPQSNDSSGFADEKREVEVNDVEMQEPPPTQNSSTNPSLGSNVVAWDGPNDPDNPMNWPRWRKWACTFALGFITFCVTFASSVFSAAILPAAKYFHTSAEVMILGTAIFVLGFAFGPILWGPLSELYGRKIPLFIGVVMFGIFEIPTAVASNIQTLVVCRFLAGVFGSAPLTIVGGALADFWNPVDRGIAVAIFSVSTFLGPTMGPIVGGFLTENESLGWRWTSWITIILTAGFGLFGFLVYPESFAPVLLQRREKRRRHETKDGAIYAAHDGNRVNLRQIGEKYLSRPLIMLVKEPILLLVTIYMSFIYGILYLFFEAYPISFQAQRGWSLGVGSLPFIAVMCGVVCGAFVIFYFTKTRYARIVKERGHAPPEERLIPMMIGGGFLPIGLFWYAWTSSPQISPWPQIIAGAPIGMGILLIFLQGLNYIIDVYLMNANSAIAGNTFVRSWLGAGFPMFAGAMYRNLGVAWATSLLGFLALALFPVPILFYIFGARIRKLSRYSPDFPPGGPPGPPR